jgi:hypothetical protein
MLDDLLPSELKDALLADASEKLELPISDLQIVKVQTVTWSDGSLGASRPGEVYTQALVPRYQVMIGGGEKNVVYHTNESSSFRIAPWVEGRPDRLVSI